MKQLKNIVATSISWGLILYFSSGYFLMLLEFGFISTPFLFDILGITTLLTLLSQRAYESSTGKSIPFWKRLWQLIQMLIVTCIGLCGLSDVFQIIAFL